MKRCVNTLILVACIATAISAAVSGRVVNTGGTGVADAMVCYKSLANRLIYVYTDANGNFSLPAPTEWSIDDLPMYKSVPTSVQQKPGVSANAPTTSLNAHFNGTTLFFTLGSGSWRVTVDIFDVSGKRILRVLDKDLAQGTQAFFPFANRTHFLPRQMYIVRLSNGATSESFKVFYTGTGAASTSLESGLVESVKSNPELAKVASVDSIRAGKTGYAGKSVVLTTYNDAVGSIQITAINIDSLADAMLAKMSTNEKIGQTMEAADYTSSFVTTNYPGSLLKTYGWTTVNSAQNYAINNTTGNKIPLLNGNDCVHGGNVIYFPHNGGMGASNDTALMELAYRCYSMLTMGYGNLINFAPCIDVPRDDHYGRVYEGWSEITNDACQRARAAVRGVQGTDLASDWTAIATVKHFAGAGGTAGGNVDVASGSNCNTGSLAQLSKIHLPQFHAAVQAGAASVMTAYNEWLNTPSVSNKALITDTLKTAWGFDGYVISDWCTMTSSGSLDLNSVNGGEDMAMVPDAGNYTIYLNGMKSNVGGSISTTRLNDMVKRILRIKYRMNLFARPMPRQDLSTVLTDQLYRNVARVCVAKSLILLKNNNSPTTPPLPLKKNGKIYVVGNWGDNIGLQCGGWSATDQAMVADPWQGSYDDIHFVAGSTTLLQGLQAVASANGGTVTYSASSVNTTTASASDVIICCVGETPYAEQAGVWSDITIDAHNPGGWPNQQTLVQQCKATGKPVITVVIAGRPIPLGTIPGNSDALVMAWLPGTEGAGIADVFYGDRNFTGKLRFSWPASNGQEPINANDPSTNQPSGDVTGSGGTPTFAYGTGLTY